MIEQQGVNVVREVTAVNFRQNPGELLSQVQTANNSILISEDGKPIAALVDLETFTRTQRLWADYDKAVAKIAKAFEDIPEAEGMAMIDELVAQERRR